MNKKKTKPKPKAVVLNKVQLTYIQTQMYKVSPEEIAKDLDVPLSTVKKQIEVFRQQDAATPAPPPTEGVGKAPQKKSALERFQTTSSATGEPIPGVAVLTPQQAQQDDADLGASPFGCADLTEAQRTYIRDKMGQIPPDQIAKDCGLPPFVVRQVIEALNPAQVGREKFYERHRQNLHKIRPNEPIR